MNTSKKGINLYFNSIAWELFWRELFCLIFSAHTKKNPRKIEFMDMWAQARNINFKIAAELSELKLDYSLAHNALMTSNKLSCCLFCQYTVELLCYTISSIRGLHNFVKYGFPEPSPIWFMEIFLWWYCSGKKFQWKPPSEGWCSRNNSRAISRRLSNLKTFRLCWLVGCKNEEMR